MCNYTIEYRDRKVGTLKDYKCPHNPISNGYCIFHAKDYWRSSSIHEEEVRKEFYKLVEDAITKGEPLFCIGFNLPSFDFRPIREKGLKIEFKEPVYFIGAEFEEANFNGAKFKEANFAYTDFMDEVDFSYIFTLECSDDITIRFDYSTFRKKVRFIGKADNPLRLQTVSFKGVDLTNVEFYNVEWRERSEFLGLVKRNIIVDEEFLDKNHNYEEVSKIYNQLRKNYETRLLFNEASHFFIGEMEAIRKKLWRGNRLDKLGSIPYLLYKYIAMYGESAFLPLVVWTPIVIISFLALRIITNCNDINDITCITQQAIDGISAYFQFPKPDDNIGVIERLVSIPILGAAFIALRRKFERRK